MEQKLLSLRQKKDLLVIIRNKLTFEQHINITITKPMIAGMISSNIQSISKDTMIDSSV